MNIKDIYEKYKIMPSLQKHMVRVAAVAKIIINNIPGDKYKQLKISPQELICACLLHDMGNIIKFNLSLFPEFLEPEGLNYWESVQNEFFEKYGYDEHSATTSIAEELGVNTRTREILEAIGFSKATFNLDQEDYSKKIACYVDHRVAPHGITTLESRMSEGHKRFSKNKGFSKEESETYEKDFSEQADAMRQMESQIFKFAQIVPDEITEELSSPIQNQLLEFAVH